MLTSYHNHTTWSDGKCPLDEMIAAARLAGLDELGISDHFTWHPERSGFVWSMPVEFLGEYVNKLSAAAAAERGKPVLRIGIEVDYFPANARRVKAEIDRHPFDYVIASVHFAKAFAIDAKPDDWEGITEEKRNEVWRRYWLDVAAMAEVRLGDIIGHLDLPKKFGYLPTIDLRTEEDRALDAIAAAGQAIEINTAGWRWTVREAYPALRLLEAARRRGIPLVINADAHCAEDLTRDFDRARALAREAGYREIVRFERRRMISMPLG